MLELQKPQTMKLFGSAKIVNKPNEKWTRCFES